MGGTGKTPLTLFLIEALTAKGFNVGVISRGYGGKSERYPMAVNEYSLPTEVGDEPYRGIPHMLLVPMLVLLEPVPVVILF